MMENMTKLQEYCKKVMVMKVMMMMNPSPPSGVSAKAMLIGEEYFPASFFGLRAFSSWNEESLILNLFGGIR